MKCDNCLNARRIISENGLHSVLESPAFKHGECQKEIRGLLEVWISRKGYPTGWHTADDIIAMMKGERE